MKNLLRSLLLLATLLPVSFLTSNAQALVGITAADQLIIIPSALAPAVVIGPFPITGMASGQTVAGADFRPRTGELFLLGYNSSNGEARLYTVSQATGLATPVGASNMTLALGTGSIGFDFNPAVDLIRVVAANRANYRLSPVTGAIVAMDGQLTYATGDPNASAIPSIGAAAYTNSYVASEVTTLYDYDESLNILTTQNPPNNGTLNTVGSSNIVSIGTPGARDMDIAFDSATRANQAYLSMVTTVGTTASTTLYTVNLATGAATSVGAIGLPTSPVNVKDIAVVINRSIPATVTGQLVYGLTRVNRNLISFDSDAPGVVRKFMPVTGLTAGQRLVGMDFRPLDRRLYALGYNDTSAYTIYTIDTATGAATAVNTTPGTLALGGAAARIGFDFNPTVDRIRVTSSTGTNYRLNPLTGGIAATDSNLQYVTGDVNAGRPARVGSVAYTNSFQNTTATTLFAIDDSLGALLVIDTPNAGKLRTLAASFFPPNQVDPTNDFDIFYDSTAGTNRAYLAVNTGASVNDSLWMFNIANSTTVPTLTPVGRVGFGVQVMDIAVQLRFSGTTSIRELSAVPGVDVYPNPAGETLFVRTEGTGTVRAVVMDLSGRTVLSADGALGTVLTLGVGRLPAGVYNLRLESGGKILGAAKVVKQ